MCKEISVSEMSLCSRITVVAYFVFVLHSFYLRCYFFCLHGSAAAPTGRISLIFDTGGPSNKIRRENPD